MAFIIVPIVVCIAFILVAWGQVKADQERARRGEPKKHDEQIFTVIGLHHHNKD